MVAGSMSTIPIKVGYLTDETVMQPWSGWYMLQDSVQAMPPRQDRTITDGQGMKLSCWTRLRLFRLSDNQKIMARWQKALQMEISNPHSSLNFGSGHQSISVEEMIKFDVSGPFA